jgi:hypothetical protein
VSIGPTELVLQVRRALRLAGFHLVSDANDGTPGLRVSEIPAGALVSWTPLGGLGSLAGAHADRDDSPGSVVQAAVEAVLLQQGHTIVTGSAGSGVVVLHPDRIRAVPDAGDAPGRGSDA